MTELFILCICVLALLALMAVGGLIYGLAVFCGVIK